MSEPGQILVVEDDPLGAEILRRELVSRGYGVAAVASGEECLSQLEAALPDLILLDIQLPGISGLEVLAQIRARFARDRLPVILATGRDEPADVVIGLEAGANDYVTKPVNLPVLLARMEVHLKLKHSVEQLVQAERQRVMLESLGAACHHLAQPMTAVIGHLDLLIRRLPKRERDLHARLDEIRGWTNEVADLLHRMQRTSTYRTVPYTRGLDIIELDETDG